MRTLRNAFPWTIFLLAATAVAAFAQVAFFEHYDGRGASFRAGIGNRATLPPNWNDRISSVRVDDGYVLVLYEHFHFKGRAETLVGRRGGTLYNLGNFNDMASSFRVRRDRPGTAPPSDTPEYPRGPVAFFEDFDGRGPGFDDSRDRSVLSGRWNDRISSIWVAEGYEVTVYEHFDYRGESRRLSGRRGGALHDLRDFNNRISSYRIRRGYRDDGYGHDSGRAPRPHYGAGTATGSQCFIGTAAGPSFLAEWLRSRRFLGASDGPDPFFR